MSLFNMTVESNKFDHFLEENRLDVSVIGSYKKLQVILDLFLFLFCLLISYSIWSQSEGDTSRAIIGILGLWILYFFVSYRNINLSLKFQNKLILDLIKDQEKIKFNTSSAYYFGFQLIKPKTITIDFSKLSITEEEKLLVLEKRKCLKIIDTETNEEYYYVPVHS